MAVAWPEYHVPFVIGLPANGRTPYCPKLAAEWGNTLCLEAKLRHWEDEEEDEEEEASTKELGVLRLAEREKVALRRAVARFPNSAIMLEKGNVLYC